MTWKESGHVRNAAPTGISGVVITVASITNSKTGLQNTTMEYVTPTSDAAAVDIQRGLAGHNANAVAIYSHSA